MAEISPNAVTATAPLSQLHPSTALWRIAKLTITEICTRLTAFSLPTDGTKQTLAARLHAHLYRLCQRRQSVTRQHRGRLGSRLSRTIRRYGGKLAPQASCRKERHGRHAAEEKACHGRRSRWRHGHRRPSREDAETIRALLCHHDHHHVRRRAHNPRSRSLSLATTASDLSSEGSLHFPRRRTSTTPSFSQSSSSSGSSPRRSHDVPADARDPLTAHRGTGLARVKLPKGAGT